MMGLHRAAVCGLLAADAASTVDLDLIGAAVAEISPYVADPATGAPASSASFPDATGGALDEKSAITAFAAFWHVLGRASLNAEYLFQQLDESPARWAAITESLAAVADVLPPHFTTAADDWASEYAASSTFGEGSPFSVMYSGAMTEFGAAVALGSALTVDSSESEVDAVYLHIAQGNALIQAALKYVEQRNTELFDSSDWHEACPAGVGLDISDGLYGVDSRSKHFSKWSANGGVFEDGAGWRVVWEDCAWVVYADEALLPQFSGSSSPCQDNLEAANHLLCQPTDKHRDSICTEVAAAGLCSTSKTNHALVRAVCPVSCGVPASECTKDADAAAADMAAIWSFSGVSTCKDLILQAPNERVVLPVICRFSSVRTTFTFDF